MKKKILITGASGFIGNHVVNTLFKECGNNFEIIATSLSEEKAKEKDWIHKVSYISCNLHENRDFYEYFKRPDIVIHLSWFNHADYYALFHIENSLMKEYSFLKQMLEGGCKHLLVAGTYAEYGNSNGRFDEGMPSQPISSYALAKDTLRKMLGHLQKKYDDVNICWMRFFNIFGKGQHPRTFLGLLEEAIKRNDTVFNMSGGEQLRDFLSVEDATVKVINLMNKKADGIFNICSGHPLALRSIAEDFIQKEKSHIKLNLGYYPYSPHEPMACWGNGDKYLELITDED